MNLSTHDGFGNSDYEPTPMDEALAELADCISERDEVRKYIQDRREAYWADLAELERKLGDDLAKARETLATWDRRVADAARRARALEAPAERLAPIAGGGPFEPTEEDWADYREWADRVDREWRADQIDREWPGDPEPPMWGYE